MGAGLRSDNLRAVNSSGTHEPFRVDLLAFGLPYVQLFGYLGAQALVVGDDGGLP